MPLWQSRRAQKIPPSLSINTSTEALSHNPATITNKTRFFDRFSRKKSGIDSPNTRSSIRSILSSLNESSAEDLFSNVQGQSVVSSTAAESFSEEESQQNEQQHVESHQPDAFSRIKGRIRRSLCCCCNNRATRDGSKDDDAFLASHAAKSSNSGKLTHFFWILLYATYNIAPNLSMFFLLQVLMPLQMESLVGKERKSSVLGTTIMICSLANAAAMIIMGYLSDKITNASRVYRDGPTRDNKRIFTNSMPKNYGSVVSSSMALSQEKQPTNTLQNTSLNPSESAPLTTPLSVFSSEPTKRRTNVCANCIYHSLSCFFRTNMTQMLFIWTGSFLWSCSFVLRDFFMYSVEEDNVQAQLLIYGAWTAFGFLAYAAYEAPFNALMIYLFPQERFGLISGLLGFTTLLATAVGVGLFSSLYEFTSVRVLSWIVFAIINLFGVVLIPFFFYFLLENRRSGQKRDRFSQHYMVIEGDSAHVNTATPSQNRSIPRHILSFFHAIIAFPTKLIKPFSNRNFFYISCVRFLIYTSTQMTQTFVLYFLGDIVQDYTFFGNSTLITSKERAQSVLSCILLLSGLASSLLSGWISDKTGHLKFYVSVSALIFSFFQIVQIMWHNFTVISIVSVGSGLCVGTFLSTDYALASLVLPSAKDAGKDLSLYAAAKTVPILIATPLSGWLLDLGNHVGEQVDFLPSLFGYYVVFLMSGTFAALAGFCVLLIQEPNRRVRRIEVDIPTLVG